MTYFLAIDQGTTSSRAIVFDSAFKPIATGQQKFVQSFPQDGWVEHNPEDIWQTCFESCQTALAEAEIDQISAIGITNQRETTIVWGKTSGKAIYPAIVWQDRRTAEHCELLESQGYEETIQQKTGLLLDPYFSASKIGWILDNVDGARVRAENGELLFGTVDSYLIWRLTEGRVHATDATNASRTALFNIHTQQWDDALLELFNIPKALLPEVKDCADDFGETHLFGGSIPIRGVAGDQSAAMVGQTCFSEGMMKCTFGTGAFMMLNTGSQPLASKHRLLSTVAYRLNGQTSYALEGSVFIAGAAIKWLREKAHLIEYAAQSEEFARDVDSNLGVYFVPALTGLGAPHWRPDARGAIVGLTRDSDQKHIVRAALESIAYQTYDLATAMQEDGASCEQLRVDGGMVHNTWFCQFLADVLEGEVSVPAVIETTALGAAYLAALGSGAVADLDELVTLWHQEDQYESSMSTDEREELLRGWDDALGRMLRC